MVVLVCDFLWVCPWLFCVVVYRGCGWLGLPLVVDLPWVVGGCWGFGFAVGCGWLLGVGLPWVVGDC